MAEPKLRISLREAFNAAHQLSDPARSDDENRRLYGKCVNLHGHNYVVEVVVTGKIDPATGYLMDLKQLSDLMASQIIERVDHRNLNTDIPWLRDRIPTAENLAVAFWDRLRPPLPGSCSTAWNPSFTTAWSSRSVCIQISSNGSRITWNESSRSAPVAGA